MKKSTIIIIAVVAVIVIWAVAAYNGLVNKEEAVESQWAQVENVYQRRADLIPNLVATVKGCRTRRVNFAWRCGGKSQGYFNANQGRRP